MEKLKQFVPVRIIPDKYGVPQKVPVDAAGIPSDPHNPTGWMSHAEALSCGFDGAGFVLTSQDPYFCIDIDDCATPQGTWSDIAQGIMAELPGAMVELSYSGGGLHVWGRYSGVLPEHACKNITLHIEMYHEKRFILIGSGATGNCELDFTEILPTFIQRWFPPNASNLSDAGWTEEADPEWFGTNDDDELIRKAMAANSASSVFGDKASFRDLWECNIDILSEAFPAADGIRPYDGSSADAALAQRLAFWAGKNCERIRTLMQKSALVRDKWDREDYLPRTIMAACSRQAQVYKRPTDRAPDVSDITGVSAQANAPVARAGGFMTQADLPALFQGCTYISDIHRIMVPGGFFLKPEQFKVMYGGSKFMLDDTKTTRSAWEAFTESSHFRPPMANSSCFRPDLEAGEIIEDEGRKLVNTWFPIVTSRMAGDVTPFTEYMKKLLPDETDRSVLLSYAAAVVQYPGVKFQWAPVLQGAEGNGKSLIMSAISHAVGLRYTHMPNAQDLGSKFNSWLQNKLFIGIEEVYAGDKREMMEALKPLITNTRVEIQGKGVDQFTGDNRANFILCTNYKDAMPITQDTRRYSVFFTAQQCSDDLKRDGMMGDYFPKLYAWLRSGGYAMVTNYLANYPIEAKYNPATKCHRAPVTTAFSEAIKESRGRVEQEILEAIEQGRPGFRGDWVSSIMLDGLLESRRLAGKVPPNKRRALMQSLGYDYHPALVNGRINTITMPDGGKPRLYIRQGSIVQNIDNGPKVAQMYSEAQGAPEEGLSERAAKVFAK